MSTLTRLACLALLITGCSSSVDALKNACIPGVDCAAIDTIETPEGCSVCTTCSDNWGSCDPGGLACKRGWLDLDPEVPGCETATSDAQGRWVTDPKADTISFFYFNQAEFDVFVKVLSLVYDRDDPTCIPTFTLTCPYTVRALELQISDFSVPESSWSGGVATLNGPIAAYDDSTGIAVHAPMLFAFDVQQGSKRRVALSSAVVDFGFIPDEEKQRDGVLLQVKSIDFGGYKITDLFDNDELIQTD